MKLQLLPLLLSLTNQLAQPLQMPLLSGRSLSVLHVSGRPSSILRSTTQEGTGNYDSGAAAGSLGDYGSATSTWDKQSWKLKGRIQMPVYDDQDALKTTTDNLSTFAPLVFAGEVRDLHTSLARASQGQGFLLMGGDCAESLDDFSVDSVRDTFRVILQMSLILTFGSALPVVKVGRMAGQFAKPRSESTETVDGVTLPTYRGDIINADVFTPEGRKNDPSRMERAYHQSAQTLNILRGK